MPRVSRVVRTTLLAAALAALAASAAAPAAGATAGAWSPVTGLVRGAAVDATADGPRVLVLSLDRRRLIVSTVRDRHIARRHVIRAGTVKGARIVALPEGRAVAVWGGPDGISSAYRPTAAARFGAPIVVSRHPGAATAFARAPTVAVTPSGRVVAAWWGGPVDGSAGIWAADLGSGGAWSAPVEVSAPAAQPQPPLAAAASPDGGMAVAWRENALPPTGDRRATITGAARPATGAWAPPVALGTGSITSYDLTAASPTAGTVAAAWAESRAERPDRVTSSTCLVAAVATAGAPTSRSALTCRAQYSPGRVRLVAAADGGLLAAWQAIPDYGPGHPLRSGIELFRAAPGSGAWAPSGLAVADTLGYWDLEAFAPVPGGGALVLSDLAQTVRGTGGRQVRAVVVGDDGAVARRVAGPTAPRPAPFDKRLFALTTGRDRGLMAQTTGGFPYRTRITLLRLPQR